MSKSAKRRHSSVQLERILHRIWIATGVLIAIFVVGSLGFRYIDGPDGSIEQAFYMTLITVTTVGYEEAVPLKNFGAQLFGGLISLVGFGTITFLFTSLTLFFLESDLDLSLRRRRMEKKIKQLHSHYIICGFGRVGRNVGEELLATGRPFVAIEPVGTQLDDLAERFPDLLYLHGDATDDDLLRACDIGDATGLFAVTGDDSVNLMITITAKQLNPKVRVVARCHEQRNIEKLRKAGADAVFSPDFTGGRRIASLMLRPHVVTFLDEMLRTEHNVRVEEIALPASFETRPLQSLIQPNPEYILISVRIGSNWVFNPPPDFSLEAGQVLITMASPAGRKALEAHVQNHSKA